MYKILALTSLIALTNAQGRGDPTDSAAATSVAGNLSGNPTPGPNPAASDKPAVVAGNLGGNPTSGPAQAASDKPAPTDQPATNPTPDPATTPDPAPAATAQPAPATTPDPARAPVPSSVPVNGLPAAPPTLPPVVQPPKPHNQASNGDTEDLSIHDIELDYKNKKIEHLDIDPSEDAHTQPMCAIGGQQSHADNERPTDYCCRIYELQNFYGRYYDLCYREPLSSGKHDTFTLSKYGWHEEVSSWKCGAKVEMTMCTTTSSQEGECSIGNSESGGRNSQNSRTHFDDRINHIKLEIARTKFSATIYEFPGCSGKSQLLKGKEVREGSWMTYQGTPHKSQLLYKGTVNSVFLDELTDISFYKEPNFIGDQWTVRNFSATSPKCIELTGFDVNPFGPVVGIDWYNGLHAAWVHKNWFPNGDAVPAASWSI